MQDTVEVIINADGKSCTTLNPYGWKRPEEFKTYQCDSIEYKNRIHLIKLYDQAEAERKTHEIANAKEIANIIRFKPGTTHKAQIINNKAVIL